MISRNHINLTWRATDRLSNVCKPLRSSVVLQGSASERNIASYQYRVESPERTGNGGSFLKQGLAVWSFWIVQLTTMRMPKVDVRQMK